MLLYSEKITPRLRYITDFIGKEITGKAFELTDDAVVFQNYAGTKINYSNNLITHEHFTIGSCGLLSQICITEQKIECFEYKDFKAFFKTTGDYPFDIFAASFYLLSRYEEYLPHKKDMYGRYAHENSLAYKEGFLNLPFIHNSLSNLLTILMKPTHTSIKVLFELPAAH
jgi:hypothetical protein